MYPREIHGKHSGPLRFSLHSRTHRGLMARGSWGASRAWGTQAAGNQCGPDWGLRVQSLEPDCLDQIKILVPPLRS